ncbi:MAG TPA: GNAT family N-acetyltransferase [Candidatus Polarisedimenticolia bacterium]|nr:GNAT family N-acetyltransferase [Candidatus Polarisedimenticolia bacterium]
MQTLSRLLSSVYFGVLTKTQSWRYRGLARNATLRGRRYQPGDERGIVRLFRLTFRQRKSLSRWRWEFLENPYGKANIVLLESEKAGIVGHYGGIVLRFNFQGDVIPASQLVDVMIHPAFRGRATLERLVRAYIETSRDDGIKLLYGFNEVAVARSNRRYFGAELALVSEWVHEISRSQALYEPADDDPEVSPAARFDAQADALWERVKGSYPCAAVRDSRYLNWRYSARSDRDYVRWQATDPSSGRIVGVAVLGGSPSDGLILELLSDPDDTKAMTALLRASIAHFSRAGKLCVRAWLPARGMLRNCAHDVGFRTIESGFRLNLLRLDDSLDAAALREDFYYTLGDYDVY